MKREENGDGEKEDKGSGRPESVLDAQVQNQPRPGPKWPPQLQRDRAPPGRLRNWKGGRGCERGKEAKGNKGGCAQGARQARLLSLPARASHLTSSP